MKMIMMLLQKADKTLYLILLFSLYYYYDVDALQEGLEEGNDSNNMRSNRNYRDGSCRMNA